MKFTFLGLLRKSDACFYFENKKGKWVSRNSQSILVNLNEHCSSFHFRGCVHVCNISKLLGIKIPSWKNKMIWVRAVKRATGHK